MTELPPAARDGRPARAGSGPSERDPGDEGESPGVRTDGSPAPHRSGQHAVLHHRGSAANRGREREIAETLEALSAEGYLDDVEHRTWPGRVSLGEAEAGRSEYVEAFESFRSWASEHGTSVCPPFLVRERTSAITGERDVVLVTPTVFLAVYDDDGLVDVYPREDGDSVATIDDWLARVEAEGPSGGMAAPEDEISETRPWRDRQAPGGGRRTR